MDHDKILDLNRQMLEVAEDALDFHLENKESMAGRAAVALLVQIKNTSKASAVLLQALSQQEANNG